MGYKLLGYVVWQGGKWYVRRRVHPSPHKVAIAGLAGAALAGGAVVAQRRAAH
jgi:hypothetical protein